jgi:eukaryotic-like serine/threonine-protein kinase
VAEAEERVVGRYALLGELASGGMATVHFGRLLGPVGFSRTVAIKRLHAQFAKDPEFVAMFLDEARLAARIQHPNVVSTLDVVALEGELLLVLEYVHGEALAQLLRTTRKAKQPLPLKIVAAIASGMLHGLHAAHEAKSEHGEPLGIVHRDMSPQNVLVGIDGSARVLDFGVAKAVGRVVSTREGQLKGKLAYMSPEQVHGGAVDRRTDIYAASIVVWEVLTGRRLFDGDNEGLLFSQVSRGTMKRPSEVIPDLPPELDAIVMRGLAREAKDRYATAWDMAVALEEAIGLASPRQVGEWVAATAGDRLEKRARRVTEIESISTLDFVPVSEVSRGPQSRDSAILVAAPREGSASRASLHLTTEVRPPASPPPLPTAAVDHASVAAAASPLEPHSQISSVAVPAPFTVPTTAPRPGWLMAGAAAVALALLLGLVVWLQSGNRGVAAAGDMAPSTAPLPPAPASIALPQSPPPPVASAVLTAAPAVSSAPARSAATARPRPAAAPASDCSPPYTINAAGIRKLKPQCL